MNDLGLTQNNMSYLDDLKKYRLAERRLKDELRDAFEKRKLPKTWEIGQRIRYITTNECVWDAGDIGYVVAIRDEYRGKKASDYQVFYTGGKTGGARLWTTPNDVELVEE